MKNDDQVQKSRLNKNLDLIVYTLIQKGKKVSHINNGKEENSICAILSLNKKAIGYYTDRLKRAGMIERMGYGSWVVLKDFDEEELKEVQKTRKVSPANIQKVLDLSPANRIRGHAFVVTVDLPKNVRNWGRREELLRDNKIDFTPLKILGGGQRIMVRGRKIVLTNKSIIVYETMNYLSNFVRGIDKTAIYTVLNLVRQLGKRIGLDYSYGKINFRVSRRHYALVKNPMAKQLNEKGIKINIYDNGKNLFTTDASLGGNEFEILNPEDSKDIESARDILEKENDPSSRKIDEEIRTLRNELLEIKYNKEALTKADVIELRSDIKILTEVIRPVAYKILSGV